MEKEWFDTFLIYLQLHIFSAPTHGACIIEAFRLESKKDIYEVRNT